MFLLFIFNVKSICQLFCLTQVQDDIVKLRQKWVQLRVDRVTHNTFQLYQVREQLKLSKVEHLRIYQVFKTHLCHVGAFCGRGANTSRV